MSSARRPGPAFSARPASPAQPTHAAALDGLCALALPFLMAFALRPHLVALHAPAALRDLADGGFVLIDVLLVVVGFRLCPRLTAGLAEGRSGLEPAAEGLRRVGPLHLVAWLVTMAWVVTGLGRSIPESISGSPWAGLSSALLINGIAGPGRAGYPASWAVSIAVWGVLLLLAVAALLPLMPLRPGAPEGTPLPQPGVAVTGIAVGTGLSGVLLLVLWPDRPLGQGLLGLAAGLLAYRVLEGSTGPLTPPLPGIRPKPRRQPGAGLAVWLLALLICVYRWDLTLRLHLLPAFVAGAGLVYVLARPSDQPAAHRAESPLLRLFLARPVQWLGSRSLAVYILEGPVQLSAERISRLLGADPDSALGSAAVVVAVLLGSVAAGAGLDQALGRRPGLFPGGRLDPAGRTAAVPASPASPAARLPRTRAERISLIDLDSIPDELRLRPLPPPRGPGA